MLTLIQDELYHNSIFLFHLYYYCKIKLIDSIFRIKNDFIKLIEGNLKKKNVSRIRKKTFYLQFCMGNPEGNEFAG
jgi:hypothetical protein